MTLLRRVAIVVVLGVVLVGCAKKQAKVGAGGGVEGETSKPGAYLAYEHRLDYELPAEQVHARVAAVRAACDEARYGACSVIALEENPGSYGAAKLTLRAIPTAVEPLAQLAGEGGKLAARAMKAEDLADVVLDVASKREALQKQRARLRAFEERKDLAVGDMLTLAREVAATETELEALDRQAADQRRRIETNLVTFTYRSEAARPSSWAKLRDAGAGSWDQFIDGTAEAIEMAGYGLPFLLLAFPAALLWRWAWRRVTRRGRNDAAGAEPRS